MPWYMAEYWGETENAYERFDSDEDAIAGFTRNVPEEDSLVQIWRCLDDECLTPEELVWPQENLWREKGE